MHDAGLARARRAEQRGDAIVNRKFRVQRELARPFVTASKTKCGHYLSSQYSRVSVILSVLAKDLDASPSFEISRVRSG
jgi:hypothetical protein